MLTSSRRGISYPNPDRSDIPDIPAHIGNLVTALEQDVLYGQGALNLRPVSTPGTPGIAGRIYVATDQTPHQIFYDYGTGWDGPIWLPPTSFNLSGTYATRPAASAALNGYTYFATDTRGQWLCVAGAWVLIAQGRPLISVATFAAAPYSTPYDGQEVALAVGANDEAWHLRYNAAATNANKWEFLGGPPISAFTNTFAGTVADGTYKNSSLGVTLPRAGDYRVRWSGSVYNTTAVGGSVFAQLALGTGSIVPVGQTPAQVAFAAQADMRVMSLDTPVFNATTGQGVFEIIQSATGMTVQLGDRQINAIPIRIS